MKTLYLLAAILMAFTTLPGCEKLKEMTGAGVDNAKIVQACKSVDLGMKTSDMLNIMGSAVYERDGKGEEAGRKFYVFTSSAAVKASVIIAVDTNSDAVVNIQCDENYIKSAP